MTTLSITAPKTHDAMTRIRITPEMAAKWLEETNLQNRRLNEAKVKRFAEDIRSGNWSLTHQGIAFDTNGVLIDGQHRLWAIVEADVPVEMYVGSDFSPSIRYDVDNVTPRSITDHLKIAGKHGDLTHQHTALAKALARGMRQKVPYTAREVDDIFQRHGDAIRFAMAVLPKGPRRAGIAVAPVRAVFARAWYSASAESLAEFAHMLVKGIVSDPVFEIIGSLRNYLQQTAKITDSATSVQKYAKTERALQACLKGKQLSLLRPCSKELFPLPEEVKA